MVKQTKTIRRPLPTNCLSVFNHFVVLVLKGLIECIYALMRDNRMYQIYLMVQTYQKV